MQTGSELTVRKCVVCGKLAIQKPSGLWTADADGDLEALQARHKVTVILGRCFLHIEGQIHRSVHYEVR